MELQSRTRRSGEAQLKHSSLALLEGGISRGWETAGNRIQVRLARADAAERVLDNGRREQRPQKPGHIMKQCMKLERLSRSIYSFPKLRKTNLT